MTKPDPQVLEDIRQMLARATPAQNCRLFRDIMQSAPAAQETVKYDA
jgi:hypothetical protein